MEGHSTDVSVLHFPLPYVTWGGGLAIITASIVIFQHLVAVIALLVTAYSFSRWKQQRMMYFALLTLAVAFYAFGYLFEVTSQSLDGATIACKVTYLGSAFIGSLYYLFSRDYVNKPPIAHWKRNVLLITPLVFITAVFLYPAAPVYYTALAYSTSGWQPHLVVTPGPLYYPCFVFIFAFIIYGTYNLVRGFISEGKYEGGVVFIFAAILPMLAQIAKFLALIPGEWNPISAALVLSVTLLCWYLARYRQLEWQSTGREIVVQNMRDGYILVDMKRGLLDSNEMAQRYFPELKAVRRGTPLEEIPGFPMAAFNHEGPYDFDAAEKTVNLRLSTTPIESAGVRTGTSILIYDITEIHEMMHELTRLARHDALTGLYNRATFFHDAEMSFDLCLRQSELTGCALMMDIDFFKQVNDSYGHAVGDKVLHYIGELLSKRFRHTDLCGRYGGEELCVWLPATSFEGALQVAEEIRRKVEEKAFKGQGYDFNVTVSIGVASMQDSHPKDFEELMNRADIALYEAKNTGRNRVCVYHETPLSPP